MPFIALKPFRFLSANLFGHQLLCRAIISMLSPLSLILQTGVSTLACRTIMALVFTVDISMFQFSHHSSTIFFPSSYTLKVVSTLPHCVVVSIFTVFWWKIFHSVRCVKVGLHKRGDGTESYAIPTYETTQSDFSLWFLCGVGKTLPVHRYSVVSFHILVLQEYWVLTESRIQLKPVLGGVRIVAISISSHEQTQ